MQILLATGNQHKCIEIGAVLLPRFNLMLQSQLNIESPEETGSTFAENALIKARHACAVSGMVTIADDSGLCVDALNLSPGIRSARYAGENATGQDNIDKLLAALEGEKNRTAVFHCVLVFLTSPDDPAPILASGLWQGEIATGCTGSSGFGYDPVFYIPSLKKTAAELSAQDKNRISHRGKALRTLIEALDDRYSS